MPLILPGNVASALGGAFEVANSCRFNDGDSPRLHKTPGSAGNRRTFTFSFWVKRCTLGAYQPLFDIGGNWADFKNDDTLRVGINATGSSSTHRVTNRVFRDVSAWYHIVIRVDTTQGTAANRLRIYINGTEETSMGTSADVTQDADTDVNNTGVHDILNDQSRYFDGYAAEIVLLDGTSAAPTEFGEFDEDSPTIWKPKDVSGLSFGTNGFYLDFEDSSNLGNDANGGTDLTEVNLAAADQSVDTPTNNACTLNSLAVATSSALAFSEGNNKIYHSGSGWRPAYGTFPVSEGKWYFEVKGLLFPGTSYIQIGWVSLEYTGGGDSALTDEIQGWGNTAPAAVYDSRLGKVYWQNVSTNGTTAYGDSYTAGDVIGVALDLDNDNIYFAEDNTWKNSGDPTSGSTGTGAFSIVSGYTWVPFIGLNNATAEATFASPVQANTSDATDGNSRGQFEFAPPSGYLAICSKNTA